MSKSDKNRQVVQKPFHVPNLLQEPLMKCRTRSRIDCAGRIGKFKEMCFAMEKM